MPIIHLDTPITEANMTIITDSINSIKGAIAAQAVGLTPEERTEISALGDTRYPFAMRTVTVHAVNTPVVVPPFLPLANATRSLTLYDQLGTIVPQLVQLVEMFLEAQQLPGHNLYTFLRKVYEQAKAASEAGVPGADSIVADLAPLFEGQGNFTPEPTPPTE